MVELYMKYYLPGSWVVSPTNNETTKKTQIAIVFIMTILEISIGSYEELFNTHSIYTYILKCVDFVYNIIGKQDFRQEKLPVLQ